MGEKLDGELGKFLREIGFTEAEIRFLLALDREVTGLRRKGRETPPPLLRAA